MCWKVSSLFSGDRLPLMPDLFFEDAATLYKNRLADRLDPIRFHPCQKTSAFYDWVIPGRYISGAGRHTNNRKLQMAEPHRQSFHILFRYVNFHRDYL